MGTAIRKYIAKNCFFRSSSSYNTGDAVQLFITKDMLLLSICFIYTGMSFLYLKCILLTLFCPNIGYELNFWSGVYGTIIGKTVTLKQHNPETLSLPGNTFSYYTIGLAGLFIGLGEIIGKAQDSGVYTIVV